MLLGSGRSRAPPARPDSSTPTCLGTEAVQEGPLPPTVSASGGRAVRCRASHDREVDLGLSVLLEGHLAHVLTGRWDEEEKRYWLLRGGEGLTPGTGGVARGGSRLDQDWLQRGPTCRGVSVDLRLNLRSHGDSGSFPWTLESSLLSCRASWSPDAFLFEPAAGFRLGSSGTLWQQQCWECNTFARITSHVPLCPHFE